MTNNCLRALFIGWLAVAATLIDGVTSLAGDWPQILGPSRNGTAVDETLPEKWPSSGPKTLWKMDVGDGYAGVAVAAGRAILFHRIERNERVEALDAATGKQLWRADFPASYRGGVNSDLGPRCVPLIHNGNVYVFGAAGDLHAIDFNTGKPRWSRAAYDDHGGDLGYFGAGSTPIVVGDKLLVNIGGRNSGAGIVAFSLATGKTVWQAIDDAPSYSSPALANIRGAETAIFVTRLNCVGLNPANGEVRFRFPFGQRGPTVNAATPLVFDNQLFLTSSYGIGAKLFQLSAMPPAEVWGNDETLSSQYTTCVQHGGFLYGTHGREDVGEAEYRCVEAKTGKVRWSTDGFGVASTIVAGDRLLICKIDGAVVLATATPTKFTPLALAQVATGTVRALPALADGRLFLRASGNRGTLYCVDVK